MLTAVKAKHRRVVAHVTFRLVDSVTHTAQDRDLYHPYCRQRNVYVVELSPQKENDRITQN